MEVEVVSKKMIAPSSNVPEDHPPNITLSSLDQMSPTSYFGIIFYYNECDDPQNRNNNILKKRGESLEKSLSDTLKVFYPLAGRLNDDTTSIECNDQGVDYWEAQVNAQLSDLLLQQTAVDAKLIYRLAPPPPMQHSPTTPLLFIQVSVFECGGLAIGLRVSHLAADMHSISLFMRGWANSCSSQSPPPVTPSFNVSSILPPTRDDDEPPRGWNPPAGGGPVVSTRLVFGGEALSRVKASVGKGASRVQVATAVIWRTLAKIDEAKHGCSRAFMASHLFNARGKMPNLPTISEACFGNLWWPFVAPLKLKDGDEESSINVIDDTLGVVRDAIECAKKRAEGVVCFSDVVLMAREGWEKTNQSQKDGMCNFTSWCRMRHYEVDFGWGKPSWVSCCVHVPRDGLVIFLDAKDGDGIEAWVNLYEDTMLLFRQHPHILPFTAH